MEFVPTSLSGVLLLTSRRFEDDRGYFCETYSSRSFAAVGLHNNFVQDNHSLSRKAGTVRGLHFQSSPHAQAKLVRCVRGRLLDVAVDIRKGSPTFSQWTSHELSADNGQQLFIPAGFLHGFVTLEPDTEIVYKCDDHYAPECEGSVRFDDPDLAIDWGIDAKDAVLSPKDGQAPLLKQIDSPFTYQG
ncbi:MULTISPECIES: dTDP-4-dehydrorhamnose 3,5-epimerase [unclassified Rhizobium]|uniref:dTDP-4-dehydrorhamnose 3,5-epimerase n=1 Tax=unclassified Rhizobium TaxID=2613769 RepID=UPI001ADBA35D|nr:MULTISPECIES: dTDP-4-dehydrorhamnose 3,5-epimerase [unclassified Rhizobium]MBO9127833.1 dTDP-4-dehydrorhamnose 3,5-epimerase [Rhizobium sp. 16-488-2b]MBO9176943.1 dTDP-4-dehydrorhamnose 3,5-epimerase [Rhizobium sp. 16-488-2a]